MNVKTTRGWIVAWCVMAVAVYAAAPAGQEPALDGPVIEFEKTVHDFGVTFPGRSVRLSHEFVFHNRGNQPLRILSNGNACRTTSRVTARTVAPGESGSITITSILPVGYTSGGAFSRTIKVETNDPRHKVLELVLKTDFNLSLRWTPSLIELGRLNEGQGAEQLITIGSRQDRPFKIIDSIYEKQLFTVEAVEAAPTPPKPKNGRAARAKSAKPEETGHHPQRIRLRLKESIPAGPFFDTLHIATDRTDIPVIKIPISGEIAAGMQFERRDVFLGIIRSSQAVKKSLNITVSDPRFKVEGVTTGMAGLKAEVKPGAGGYKLELVYTPAPAGGTVDGAVVVRTNHPAFPEVRIRVWGLIKLPAKTR